MKLISRKNGKITISMTRKEWLKVGQRAGWANDDEKYLKRVLKSLEFNFDNLKRNVSSKELIVPLHAKSLVRAFLRQAEDDVNGLSQAYEETGEVDRELLDEVIEMMEGLEKRLSEDESFRHDIKQVKAAAEELKGLGKDRGGERRKPSEPEEEAEIEVEE